MVKNSRCDRCHHVARVCDHVLLWPISQRCNRDPGLCSSDGFTYLGDAYGHACADQYAHAKANRHALSDPHASADGYTHAYIHPHPYPHFHTDRHADGHAYPHAHSDRADTFTDAHGDLNVDAHAGCSNAIGHLAIRHFKEPRVKVIPLLKRLSEAEGVTGCEGPVRELLRQTWEPFVDELREDKLGNLIALKRGEASRTPRPRLMLAAHMDEIGLRVTGIDKGFLRITRVGGTDRRALLGIEVVVHATRRGRDLPGVVATRPPHVLPQAARKKTVPWDEMFVDVGLPPKKVERLVSVGDLISIRRELVELKNRRVAGKAIDNRISLVVLTLALEQLSGARHAWDVTAVATVQEEIGVRGAMTSAYGVAPDLGIALDVTFGKQPGVSDVDGSTLGDGPVILVGANFHSGIVTRMKEVAETHEIPYQLEPVPGRSGTDAWAIQVAREGVPTGLICVPVRYMHQPVETLDVQDAERAGRLLAAFVIGLEPDFLEKLTREQGSA